MRNNKKYKICRRLGAGIFEKCQNPKFLNSKKTQSKDGRPKAKSDFGLQLLEKQKIRFGYGITERQLRNYVREAQLAKNVPITDRLYEILETRLDNVIYRLGLANTRALARQMVAHGHFLVNDIRTTAPSYKVKKGDKISVRVGSRKSPLFANLDEKLKKYNSPDWVVFDVGNFEGKLTASPKNVEQFVDLKAVLEFYSR